MSNLEALCYVSVILNLAQFIRINQFMQYKRKVKDVIKHMKENYSGPLDPIHLLEEQIDE